MLNVSKYRINEPDVVSETIDGETVVVSLLTGAYYSLNGSAPQIWSFVSQGLNIEQMADALTDRFKEDRDTIHKQVSDFIAALQTESLIVLRESDAAQHESGQESIPDAQLPQAYEPPALQKFSDMQELLLLDPIHDVDTQAGWPTVKAPAAVSEE